MRRFESDRVYQHQLKGEVMTSEEIKTKLIQLQLDRAKIQSQLDEAKTKAFVDGQYADRKWFRAAEHAYRMKGIEMQQLQQTMGKIVNSEKKKDAARFERVFMETARSMMPREVFNDIFRVAMDVLREEDGESSGNR